ncbi:MAG: adenylate/guanylate cyclase domain-containing protein [Paracoccaceae bacterium]
MIRTDDVSQQAITTRIAQRLAGPVEVILGYQELIVEDVQSSGPPEALKDAQQVLKAARQLHKIVCDLVESNEKFADAAVVRHDLLTPVNAILGYSELLIEEYSEVLEASVLADLNMVIAESTKFLTQVDGLLDVSSGILDTQSSDVDVGIAAGLARTLSESIPDRAETGRILVIDDVEANRELLRRHLVRRNHTVVTAATALEALSLLKVTNFELLLVDVLMPDMNGIDLLGELKSDENLRDIPVIMVSGLKEYSMVARCIAAGAEDYLHKPIDPLLLHSRIGTCLERVRWQRRERLYLNRIEIERDRVDKLLQNMLPTPVIARLQNGEETIVDQINDCTVIFADIVNFTAKVTETEPSYLLSQLTDIFSMFDDLADKHNVEKIKTIGDAYMAVSGVPEACEDHAARGFALCRDMIQSMETQFSHGFSIRIGLHCGPVIAGLVGKKRSIYDVWGHAVNMASRLETSSQPGHIHMSSDAYQQLKTELGPRQPQLKMLKGLGELETYLID